MKITTTITGLEEAIAAMNKASDGIPAELQTGMQAAMLPIVNEMQTYPAQPPSHVAPGHAIRPYVRTGNYGKRITSQVQSYGAKGVEGLINSGASYSVYLRGDMNGYESAWMHAGIWKPLDQIVEEHMDGVVDTLETYVGNYLERLGLE